MTQQMSKQMIENWAHNIQYSAAKLHFPQTVEQVQAIVAGSRKVKALGTRHSFNRIADSTGGDLISLKNLDRVLSLNFDGDSPTVTVEAGIKCGHLGEFLHAEGFALHNLASLPHISIAGACATATHGSGVGNGNLSTAVTALKIVTAEGQEVALSRSDPDFYGAVVNLGALGIVTEMTLKIEPTFQVRQNVYENLPLSQLKEHFDAIVSSAYSVSLFTGWKEANFEQVWFKIREDAAFSFEPESLGLTPATRDLHPLPDMSAENCTQQMGIFGPWHERLPHFRMQFTPSAGEELQSEYLLPRRFAVEALNAIHEISPLIAPLLQISEVRTIAADKLWMSPCYQQDCIGIHFTWIQDWEAVKQLLPKIEKQLEPFQARPHWGKLFTMPAAQVKSPDRFPQLPAFLKLMQTYDPHGKFRNAFLDESIYAS